MPQRLNNKLTNCLEYLKKNEKQPVSPAKATAADLRYSIATQNKCLKINTVGMKRQNLEGMANYYGVQVMKKPPVKKRPKVKK
jgi:hypothetical protein